MYLTRNAYKDIVGEDKLTFFAGMMHELTHSWFFNMTDEFDMDSPNEKYTYFVEFMFTSRKRLEYFEALDNGDPDLDRLALRDWSGTKNLLIEVARKKFGFSGDFTSISEMYDFYSNIDLNEKIEVIVDIWSQLKARGSKTKISF